MSEFERGPGKPVAVGIAEKDPFSSLTAGASPREVVERFLDGIILETPAHDVTRAIPNGKHTSNMPGRRVSTIAGQDEATVTPFAINRIAAYIGDADRPTTMVMAGGKFSRQAGEPSIN
ncbi:MAG: hypothetical protein K1X83_09140 [Oligoflexia bacterium]|nr:hypothetical protein [Oligoflexia bacterium]